MCGKDADRDRLRSKAIPWEKKPPIKREVYDQEMKSKDEENGEVANGGG